MQSRRAIIIVSIAAISGLFLFFIGFKKNSITVMTGSTEADKSDSIPLIGGLFGGEKALPEPIPETPTAGKLASVPQKINALYSTSWSASSSKKIDYFIDLAKKTSANAIVIDIKDYSGILAYESSDETVKKYATSEKRIGDLEGLVKKLHDNGIYAIARVTVFQDPALAAKRPDLAVKNSKTGEVWLDNKKLAWLDPASKEVWEYTAAIAREAAAKGFDEVNFDYVRFPSDGNLNVLSYPFYNSEAKTKSESIKEFFVYLREKTAGEKISADIFGLTVIASDDMGIGQIIEDALGNFDFICPMVYPSHFANGFIGYKNPADHPYEVIKHSMEEAGKRLASWKEANPGKESGAIRPWLQDFDLGAEYGTEEVMAQVRATEETSNEGWMMWSPNNIYTSEAIILND
ncbi:MAG: putative glycoside hydrolase [Candidatus Colwellbacteria bacterium]|nr:putative glycoside hydrolase [Candidatus Colwellbacteria bacterium]